MGIFIDMTGWIMNEHGVPDSRLTVIKRVENSNGGKVMWLCECACNEHNQIIESGTHIRSGDVKSCGCFRKEKLHDIHIIPIEVGSVFGHLKVIKEDDTISSKNNRFTYYLCECDCEERNIISVSSQYLRCSKNPSCGCANKNFNNYILNLQDEHGFYGIGYCSNTNSEFYFDMDDYDKIKDYYWRECIDKKKYHYLAAINKTTGEDVRIQWVVIGKYYDHKDRNALNNRKYNLRPCTIYENNQNRSIGKNNKSGVIGVRKDKKTNKWCASITYENNKKYLGSFTNKDDAIKARLQAEVKYHGGFASQKHLYEKYGIDS